MIDISALIAAAKETTGLDDFAGEEFMEPLQRIEHALNTEADLNEMGFFRAQMIISQGLENRLKIENYIKQNPEVLEQEIEKPIFIVGLPRTGTTALHHMLNADPANHTLRLWEGNNPIPPAEEATYLTDPRIAEQKVNSELMEEAMPEFSKYHLIDAEAPDECHMLFGQCFMSVVYTASFHVPSFANWLFKQDLTPAYAYHKRQLKVMQHKKGGRWVLKTPYHQLGLAALLANYPDAIIVQTHRAPMKIVASGCSFNLMVRQSAQDYTDPAKNGRDWMDMLWAYSTAFESNRAKLEPAHPGQFIDIRHDDFVADPWPALEEIYRAAGTEISSNGRQSMTAWLEDNKKGKHGKHEYRLEDHGIDRAEVEKLFGDYVKRYNVTME